MARDEVETCFDMVTVKAARVLGLGGSYGIAEGRPASFLLLPATDRYDALRRQVTPTHVFAHGRLVAETPAPETTLHWPGEEPRPVRFSRPGD